MKSEVMMLGCMLTEYYISVNWFFVPMYSYHRVGRLSNRGVELAL